MCNIKLAIKLCTCVSFLFWLGCKFWQPPPVTCERQEFYMPSLETCHPWLACSDIDDVEVKELVGLGAVKAVYHATWKGLHVAYSILNNPAFRSDFEHGLYMLKMYNQNPNVVQLIGFCESKGILLTEFHRNGNGSNLKILLENNFTSDFQLRLKLCLNYALLLEFLHHGPGGTRVMCDSNDLEKLLSQLLITENMNIILNDLDALPEVNKELGLAVKCGTKELKGNFVAPEQRWKFKKPYIHEEMPGYDEKSDIWKVPSVCDHFIGSGPGSEIVKYRLFYIHKNCKRINPAERPTATQLVAQYIKVMHELKQEL